MIWKSKGMHIIRNINMKSMIFVRFAEIVNNAYKTSRTSLRNSIINNNYIVRSCELMLSNVGPMSLDLILNPSDGINYNSKDK